MPKRHPQTYTGIEIGTASIKVVVGQFQPDGILNLCGVAEEATNGSVVKGEIVDAKKTMEQLIVAMRRAEQTGDVQIDTDAIYLAVTGGHLHSVNSIGTVVVSNADRRITQTDRENAENQAWNYHFRPDQPPVNFFNRLFRVDGIREVDNPVGLVGAKLEAEVHIVYGDRNRLDTGCKLVEEAAGQPPSAQVFSPIAAGMATFFQREAIGKGVLVLDIGAGVTEYAVLQGGGGDLCFHTGQITVGGDHLANDLSLGLHLPFSRCRELVERLAEWNGAVMMTQDGRNRLIEITLGINDRRSIYVSTVEQILEARLKELFEMIRDDLRQQGVLERIGHGVTLCGGLARLPRLDDLVKNVLEMPAEIGRVQGVSGGSAEILNAPRFITPIGLLRFGKKHREERQPQRMPLWSQIKADAGKLRSALSDAMKW